MGGERSWPTLVYASDIDAVIFWMYCKDDVQLFELGVTLLQGSGPIVPRGAPLLQLFKGHVCIEQASGQGLDIILDTTDIVTNTSKAAVATQTIRKASSRQ